METAEQSGSILMDHFREFYTEVIRAKQRIASSAPTASMSKADSANDMALNQSIRKRLISILQKQERQAERSSDGLEQYKEAQYLMAALGDEIFLSLDWKGKTMWRSQLLESELFHSHSAGETIFRKLDKLLQERDHLKRELAQVYLMAIALGFEGKYRGEEDQKELEKYRLQLFGFIAQRDPDSIGDFLYNNEAKRLCPDTYEHSLVNRHSKDLPGPKKWFVLLALLVIGWLGMQHYLWTDLTKEIKDVIERIHVVESSLRR